MSWTSLRLTKPRERRIYRKDMVVTLSVVEELVITFLKNLTFDMNFQT